MKILREEVKKDLQNTTNNIHSMFDSAMLQLYNITDAELDYFLTVTSDEELDIFIESLGNLENNATYTQIRKGLELRNKYIKYYYDKFNK